MKKVLLFAFGMLAFLAVLIAQSQVLQNIGGTTTASGSVSGATLWGTNATEYTGTITNVNVGFALGGFHIGAAARLDYPESQVFIGDALGNGSGTLFTLDDNANTIIFAGATVTISGPLIGTGTIEADAGVISKKNNKAAPSTISVGASVFNYTNTQAVNIQVFLDANGATTAVTFNGTAIFASLVNGDHSIIMQPGDRIAVTYSVATPNMKYREF
jgi:hypothetical protein